jgi:hypothetical protein
MTDARAVSIPDMAQRLMTGDGEALLPGGVPGPVRMSDQWWAVPLGHTAYQPVTDPDTVTALDQHAARLAAQRRHVAAQAAHHP